MSSSEPMWPRNPNRAPTRTTVVAFALALSALTALAGCTVRPLYSEAGYTGPDGKATGSIGAALSTIAVKPVSNRVGQEVRNHLIFLFGGGRGQPANPVYNLTLFASAASEATTTIVVDEQNEPTSAIITAVASYSLTDAA